MAAFAYFDKDGSGCITVDELQQACADHNMGDAQISEIIKEIDQNNVCSCFSIKSIVCSSD